MPGELTSDADQWRCSGHISANTDANFSVFGVLDLCKVPLSAPASFIKSEAVQEILDVIQHILGKFLVF